jgi:hypothetical protein
MSVKAAQAVSVGTTAVQLSSPVAGSFSRVASILVVAQASGTLILGGSSAVTASGGAGGCRIPVVAGTAISVELVYGDELWAIVASGTLAVDTLQAGA